MTSKVSSGKLAQNEEISEKFNYRLNNSERSMLDAESQDIKERRFKLVVLGTTGVGKSCLALRFVKGMFDEEQLPTIGAAYMTKTKILDVTIKKGEDEVDETVTTKFTYEIWDTAGQERYEAITPLYYRSAEAAIVAFDLSTSPSFEKAKMWLDRLQKERPDSKMPIAIVGNKADLPKHDVLEHDIEAFVQEKSADAKLKYFKTSAKTGENIEEVFSWLAKNLAPEVPRKVRKQTLLTSQEKEDPGCC
eukprot:snap_masked-scaffold_6-processed-gene-11.34-mRNA-1 protein AED:0.04 eAED:0.04 QI:0/-1/0/1/-1/1/1/0/247